MTSAMMKPFSKSVWIFPAACGALVPFCKVFKHMHNILEVQQNISVLNTFLNMCFAHPDGPCTDFVRSCSEEVLQLQGCIPILDHLSQNTESKNEKFTTWKTKGKIIISLYRISMIWKYLKYDWLQHLEHYLALLKGTVHPKWIFTSLTRYHLHYPLKLVLSILIVFFLFIKKTTL